MSWPLLVAVPALLAGSPDLLPEVVTPAMQAAWEDRHRAAGLSGPDARLPCAPFAEGLVLCLQVAEGPGWRPVCESDLRAWGLDPAEARTRALQAVGRGMGPGRPEVVRVEGDPRTYLLSAEGDGRDQAGLFAPDRLASRAGGPVAVGIPARGVLVAVRLDDPDLARIVAVGVRRAFETLPEPITDTLYAWDGRTWIAWGRAVEPEAAPP